MYLLSSVSYDIQYVGENVRNVNLKINFHTRGKSVYETAINIKKNICPGSKLVIQMLLKLLGNRNHFFLKIVIQII